MKNYEVVDSSIAHVSAAGPRDVWIVERTQTTTWSFTSTDSMTGATSTRGEPQVVQVDHAKLCRLVGRRLHCIEPERYDVKELPVPPASRPSGGLADPSDME